MPLSPKINAKIEYIQKLPTFSSWTYVDVYLCFLAAGIAFYFSFNSTISQQVRFNAMPFFYRTMMAGDCGTRSQTGLALRDTGICSCIRNILPGSTRDEKLLLRRRQQLLREISALNLMTLITTYSTLRRELNHIDFELDRIQQSKGRGNILRKCLERLKKCVASHAIKVTSSLAVIYMCVYYREVPVLILDKKYDLYPFTFLIAFPNKELNAVSVHTWMLCCCAVAQLIKNK